jgi:hypothetical protein
MINTISKLIQNQFTKIFLYTSNEQTEKEYWKTIPFKIISKTIPRNKLNKEVKDLYDENYKPLKKKIEEDYRR